MIEITFRFETDNQATRRTVCVIAEYFMDARRIVETIMGDVIIYGCRRVAY